MVADAAAPVPATEAQSGREEPAELSDAPANVGAPTARVPARPPGASRPAFGEAYRHAHTQSPPRPASPMVTPVDASLTPRIPAADIPPGRDGDMAPHWSPMPLARARALAARSIASVAAIPESPGESPADQIAAPMPVPSSRAPMARVATSPSTSPQAESAPARLGEIAPTRQRDPAREVARASDASHAPPVAPTVQVSIGRVEVRAVYAPPPSPVRARAPTPTMSLDDYLKQRENGR